MPFTTYLIGEGNFCTTDEVYDHEFIASWSVSDADKVEIDRGAILFIVDGALVIDPLPYPEPDPVVVEGEFVVVPDPVIP